MLEPRAPHWKSPHLAFYASFCLFLSQQVPSPLLTLHLLNGDLIPPSGEFGNLRARGLAGVIMSCPCVLGGQEGAQVPPLGLFSLPVPLDFPQGQGSHYMWLAFQTVTTPQAFSSPASTFPLCSECPFVLAGP